jgi:hypothetical protein
MRIADVFRGNPHSAFRNPITFMYREVLAMRDAGVIS